MPTNETKSITADFLVTIDDREYPVDRDTIKQLDLIETGQSQYHLLHQGVGYRVEFLGRSADGKTISLRLNGREYQAQVGDSLDQLVRRMGLNATNDQTGKDVFAPMPGLILDLMVEPGQEIEAGTPLLILEAMKMENVIKADGAGIVTAVAVNKGQAVDKRQLLIEIE